MGLEDITPEQVDKVSGEDRWFRPALDQPPFTLILQYLAGNLSLDDTVNQLTTPISSSFTTADGGNAIRTAEKTAAQQRTFWSVDEARERWGDPLPETEIPPAAPDGTPSTEGQLWELWYAVLHAAKRTRWRNDENNTHSKLVALVAAIKRVPDPPLPANANKALRNDWIWEGGTLWSTLTMLGPASREAWNDSPGAAFGYSEAAIAAWANANAFVARLTAEDVREYSIYAIWAMREGLEEKRKLPEKKKGNWLDATVPAAAAWIAIWGKKMYERREDLTPQNPNEGNPAMPGDYMIKRTKSDRPEWSRERWAFWKQRGVPKDAGDRNLSKCSISIGLPRPFRGLTYTGVVSGSLRSLTRGWTCN
ncbi:hypothetical protein K438DRAFT_400819 [Mycena galopus ATCC 62051]|nr:hypothetical protein K438DRAFT_400819 [Mycena galopus ATCC 62051]